MLKDPLSFFTHEKVADDDAPTTAFEDDYQIPRTVSRSALDPGERALAATVSVSGSMATIALPFIGRAAVTGVLHRGSVPWTAPPIQNVESIAEALSRPSPPYTTSRPLGLFGIRGRRREVPLAGTAAADAMRAKYVAKLQEIQPVVDSFIDKHNLAKKGVRINIQHGPISALGGGGFSKPGKLVYLPRVGKELALHELGHAADYTGRFGKLRRYGDPILKRGALFALPIALVAGDRIKEMIPGTVDDKAIAFMQDHAPEIMAATLTATTLIPEARASMLAVKHLKELELAGKQPVGTAAAAIKKFIPFWGTYLLGAIPAVVGMSLARKYMREARAEKAELRDEVAETVRELEKTSNVNIPVSHAKDLLHVAKEIGRGAANLIANKGTIRQIGRAAKETGRSPEFIWGAMSAALPATMGALYMYGTPGGELIRKRLDPAARGSLMGVTKRKTPGAAHTDEEWRERNPLRFAGLVAIGAAMSGGIMTKFIHDMMKVL